jgi:phosphoglycolate phosphatase
LRVELLAVDLDGTLVDSAPDLAHCVGRALQAVALAPPSAAQTRGWIGDGVETLLRRALANAATREIEAETYDTALDAFLACYEQNLFERSRLYPAALETLDVLESRGIRLCCITNKRLAFTEELLARAGARDKFELVLGGDSLAERKPSPMQLEAAARLTGVPAARAALVGDSRHDFDAAAAAQFAFVWAAYGYCPSLGTDAKGAIERIERFSDLIELLEC